MNTITELTVDNLEMGMELDTVSSNPMARLEEILLGSHVNLIFTYIYMLNVQIVPPSYSKPTLENAVTNQRLT